MAYHPVECVGVWLAPASTHFPEKRTGNIYRVVCCTICILLYFLTVVHLFAPRKDESV